MEQSRIVAHTSVNSTVAQAAIRQFLIPGQNSDREAAYGAAAHLPEHESRDRATAITEIQLQSSLKRIEDFMQKTQFATSVSFDEKNSTFILTITDKATGELIRQYPSEELLNFAAAIDEFINTSTGLLIQEDV